MSIPSLIAATLCFLFAIITARTALFCRHHPVPRRDQLNWWALTLFFAALIVIRLTDTEQKISDLMRGVARTDHLYDERRDAQTPLVILTLLICCLGVAVFMRALRRNTRQHPAAKMIMVSRLGAAAMIVLIALRLISLHTIDVLLYRGGPIHMNYVVDFAASTTMAWAAWNYPRSLENRQSRRHIRSISSSD